MPPATSDTSAPRPISDTSLGERYLAAVAPLAAADWLGDNPHADAHGGVGHAAMMLGQPDRARAAYAHARDLNGAVGHHLQAAGALGRALEVAAHYRADRPPSCAACWTRWLRLSR
jgi:hypothetical protein